MAETIARHAGGPGPRRRAVRRFRLKWVLLASVAILTVLMGLEAYRVIAGDNLHTVIPGKVYRGAQPSAAALTRLANDYGIKTVINLRGLCPDLGWYEEEARLTHDLDLVQEDIGMSAYRLP